ncbi:nitrogenase MoFe cofactor biosynthesis protein NifE [Methanococcus vannielii SB]|uniref:Nitrogenase iron-molybdenum cofactor biosynthesis protein NifE n=1 Tax=Methanococcus vannielii (strain ATCC 35089 / DSM 1224 / JCM 13029 / OCM 148 / SB) TaxID=406327 RepID=A6UNA2_METVS|nr:nitrogenase iron-molybdenum cofactor biosynthesis protein NifE [Methanococcus vannielii]ABR53974.1 nitrogenase MoFe cofactor biosynthesis protein NifE [Methanococcus vannielii SB]
MVLNLATENRKTEISSKDGDFDIEVKIPNYIIDTLKSRESHMCVSGKSDSIPDCDKNSAPGMITQRSCVYGGARVVLMPITDAIHLVHGPIGCAACTWDIRGSTSSGDKLYKTGFSTDLREKDVVFGGENKLYESILELNRLYTPSAIFVYSTCVVGLIGDDIKAVCKKAQEITGCRVIPVQSEGFKSFNKSAGHKLACDAMIDYLIGTKEPEEVHPYSINIIGEFNVAGDLFGIIPLYEKMGVKVQTAITGDSTVEKIAKCHHAKLNIVQCQKSSNYLASKMEEKYQIPTIKVNFFGVEETTKSLRAVSEFFGDEEMIKRTEELINSEIKNLRDEIAKYKKDLSGKTVAIYSGAHKSWALVSAFSELDMEIIMSGTQNGKPEDYQKIREHVCEGTLIVDDANSMELAKLLKEYKPDILISGAKEKYISLKCGVPHCDFNHDRITAFSGYNGFINFARVVHTAVMTPVWRLSKKMT